MWNVLKTFYKRIEKKRKFFTLPHCCIAMNNQLQEARSPIVYFQEWRDYAFLIPKFTGCATIDYCIYCGTRMPDSLSDKWFFILESKYKLSGSKDFDSKNNKIPAEFLTDEWWKKRNIPNRLSYLDKRERENRRMRKKRDGCYCLDDGKKLNQDCQSDLIYNSRFREYGIKQVMKRAPYIVMKYCLWCGRQLEPSLRDLWAKLLQKYHGIENPFKTRIQFLPKSFRTDLWWKRREL